jgi:hypothetical protein
MCLFSVKAVTIVATVFLTSVLLWSFVEHGNIILGHHVPITESSHSFIDVVHGVALKPQWSFIPTAPHIVMWLAVSLISVGSYLVLLLRGSPRLRWWHIISELISEITNPIKRALRSGILQSQHYNLVAS